MMLAFLWALSVLSLATSLLIWLVRAGFRVLRWTWRRCRAHHKPTTTTSSAQTGWSSGPVPHTQWPHAWPVDRSGEVAELERCVHWLIWALSRDVTPHEVTASARATDPAWWATLARIRATIDHLSAASPEIELAAWCMAVVDLDRHTTGATR